MTITYFGIFSLVQIPQFGYKMLILFVMSLYHFKEAIVNLDENNINKSLVDIAKALLIIITSQVIYDCLY